MGFIFDEIELNPYFEMSLMENAKLFPGARARYTCLIQVTKLKMCAYPR